MFRSIYHLAKADFLSRIRESNILVILAAVAYIGYTVIAGQVVLVLGTYRGVYNSAWIGSLMSLVTTFLLTFVGFFLVKNAINLDEETGVGQIIATTPISKIGYLLGKWLSNFVLLAIIILLLSLAAVVMQITNGEVDSLQLWPLLAPFFIITLPTMALVAALAVLFESIGFLKGGFGNVVYFFGMIVILSEEVADLIGINAYSTSMLATLEAQGYETTGFALQTNPQQLNTFVWNGIDWTADILISRVAILGTAVVLTLIAAIFFNRFDPAVAGITRFFRRQKPATSEATPEEILAEQTQQITPPLQSTTITLTPVSTRRGPILPRLLWSELKLMVKGQRWWWYIGAIGFIIASVTAPDLNTVKTSLYPVTWLWPLLIWSALGARESLHHTREIIFSSMYPLRQLAITWLAGFLVTCLTGIGVLLALLRFGDGAGVGAWFVGALFIPSLALALGVWSGGSRLFEAIYLVIWYVGPANKVALVDFMGTTDIALSSNVPLLYFGLTLVLLGSAFWKRRQQLQSE